MNSYESLKEYIEAYFSDIVGLVYCREGDIIVKHSNSEIRLIFKINIYNNVDISVWSSRIQVGLVYYLPIFDLDESFLLKILSI
jgi:hypothetical protein